MKRKEPQNQSLRDVLLALTIPPHVTQNNRWGEGYGARCLVSEGQRGPAMQIGHEHTGRDEKTLHLWWSEKGAGGLWQGHWE